MGKILDFCGNKKTLGPFLLLFLLFSVAITINLTSKPKEIRTRAAASKVTLLPSSPGASTQWSRGGCSSNYDCVNEDDGPVQGSDADITYVRAGQGTFTDLYDLPTSTIPADSIINSVTVYAIAVCEADCTAGIDLLVHTRGGTYNLGPVSIPGNYQTRSLARGTNPAGGSWTVNDINNLQIGVRRDLPSIPVVLRVTKVWAEVSYSQATPTPTPTATPTPTSNPTPGPSVNPTPTPTVTPTSTPPPTGGPTSTPTPAPIPTVSLSANPSSINSGQSSTLSWVSTFANSVSVTPDIGTVGTSGSRVVRPSSSITYTAISSGPGGVSVPASASITVDNVPPPPPPPPPTPPPGSTPTPGVGSGGGGSGGGARYTSEIKLNFDPLVYLVGKLPLSVQIEETGESNSVEISSTQTEVKMALKNRLTQGRGYNLNISSDKMVDKRLSVTPNSASFALNIGQILLGDLKKDGKVEAEDLKILLGSLTSQDNKADLNYDSSVGVLDYSIINHSLFNQPYDKTLPEGEGATLSLKLATQTQTKLGDDFNVDLWVGIEKYETDGAEAIVSYDQERLELKQLLPGTNFTSYYQTQPASPDVSQGGPTSNKVRVIGLAKEGGPYLNGNFPLATLVFKLKAEGEAKIEAQFSPNKTDDSNISNQRSATDILSTAENLKLNITKDGLTAQTVKKQGKLKVPGKLPNLSSIIFFLISVLLIAAIAYFIYKKWREREAQEGGTEDIFIPPSVPLDRPPPVG